jgi:hypothetical protein
VHVKSLNLKKESIEKKNEKKTRYNKENSKLYVSNKNNDKLQIERSEKKRKRNKKKYGCASIPSHLHHPRRVHPLHQQASQL